MAAALAVAIVLSFLDGMLGIVGGIVAASLLLAYGVLGFAVLHAITQGIECAPVCAQHHLCRCNSARLADACPLSARTGRYGDRIARSRIRQTWAPTRS